MKHSSFKIICLIIWACITVFSAYGQSSAVTLESRVLESFNGDDDAPYIWKTDSSRFISAVRNADGSEAKDNSGNVSKYPLTTYVNAWPIAVYGYNRGPDSPIIRSFGLNGQFDRMGYNWIDIYPVLVDDPDQKPYEIPIPGIVKNFDMWVWGSNLRYYIEIFVRDYRGVVHSLKLGDVAYHGWKNLEVNVPNSIMQTKRILPSYAGLTFVKFRLWTQPVERVSNFYIYFKQLKVLTDMYNPLYDGNDLSDPAFIEQIWSGN